MKTKAAVLWETGRKRPYRKSAPLTVEEVDLAAPGPGEALVEIKAAGLCHSDLSVVNGDRPRPLPMALGHEAAGVVRQTGADVCDLRPGDHVVTVFVPSCGVCRPCQSGRPALCEPAAKANLEGTLLSGARRIKLNGEAVNHHLGVSAFARHAVVSRRSLVRVASDLPFEEAALFGCAALTGAGAVFNTAQTPPGASVAVVGLGGVGLCALLAARMLGAHPLIAVDMRDDKLKLAGELGASAAVNAGDDDGVAQAREASGGGVDFAFEMAGSVAAMDFAYRITRRGGTTVSAGLSHPERNFSLQHVNLVAEERTIKGSYVGGCAPVRDIPRLIHLYRGGHLPLKRLLSERVALADINAAMDRLSDGDTVRQIILP
jgi:alcohol dehydrogenase